MTPKKAFNIVRCGGLGCTEKEFTEADHIVEEAIDILDTILKHLELTGKVSWNNETMEAITVLLTDKDTDYQKVKDYLLRLDCSNK